MSALASLQGSSLTSPLSAAVSMVVLKGIPSVLSPELLYALAKMGHGDELGMNFNYINLGCLSRRVC